MLPIRGMGEGKLEPAPKAEPKADRREVGPPPKGKEKKQKVDLQANPHLCLTAKEQIDKVRTDAVVALVSAIPWGMTALGKPDPEGPGSYARTEDECYEALVRAVYATGAARNKSAAAMLHKMAAILSKQKGAPVSSDMIFPIGVGFIESAKHIFKNTTGCKTAAKSMHGDFKWLRVRITGDVTVSALSSPYLSMLRDCKCLVRCQVSVCLSQFPWLKSGGTRASLGIPDHPVRSSKPLGKARIG